MGALNIFAIIQNFANNILTTFTFPRSINIKYIDDVLLSGVSLDIFIKDTQIQHLLVLLEF